MIDLTIAVYIHRSVLGLYPHCLPEMFLHTIMSFVAFTQDDTQDATLNDTQDNILRNT